MHKFLMLVTADMPCKIIPLDGKDYLQCYYVTEEQDGTQYWLLRFLRDYSEGVFHSNPWAAESHILTGWYIEERIVGNTSTNLYLERGQMNFITQVEVNTWALMIVGPERKDEWFFIDEHGNKTIMKTSAPDWWKECKTRDGKEPSACFISVELIKDALKVEQTK